MSKNNKIINIFYLSAIVVLVVAFTVVVLEKSQITNFYSKPNVTTQEDSRPVNDVQYTPANPTDNDQINQEKQDGTIINKNTDPEPSSPISVVLTAATQDVASGPVVIRVLLTDTDDGNCEITLTKDGVTKSYSRNVVNTGTYYNCEALDIPVSELSAGTWGLNVSVTSGNRSGSASQNVEVKL